MLHIENVGKIGEANITISPLLCFMGDNNSGKSYVMSILWGILSQGKYLFPTKPSDSKAYRACEKWLMTTLDDDSVLDHDTMYLYINWFNELLTQNKKRFFQQIFNYPVEAGKLEIRNYERDKDIAIIWENEAVRYKFSSKSSYVKFPRHEEYTRDDFLRMNTYICWNLLMDGIAAQLFTPIVRGRRTGEPVYLPASRTGFMLTYSQLMERSIGAAFGDNDIAASGKLTLPYVDFLQIITKFEMRESKRNKELVSFIENNMTDGALKVEKAFLPIFKYSPQSGKADMPLYVTSSVITEVAPLLLLLKSDIDFKTVVIEEPEAHLHPALQRKMARFIVRLMNSGKMVWMTTHSDTILQHVNNMIKLSNHKDKNELMNQFGYDKADLLSLKKIGMYQFSKRSNEKTKVEQLQAGENGFVVPTFNDALADFLDEIYALQEDEK